MALSMQSSSRLLVREAWQRQVLWQFYLGQSFQRSRVYSNLATNNGSVTYLRNAETGAELYIVGTAHVSAKSAEEVRQILQLKLSVDFQIFEIHFDHCTFVTWNLRVIHQVKPDTVAVELCAERARKLMAGEENQTKNLLLEFFNFPGGLGQKLVHIATKSVYSLLRNTGVEPGKEFKVAVEEAQRLRSNLVYIDQDFRVTVKRIADVMTYQDVFKLLTNQTSDMTAELLREFGNADVVEGVEMLKTRENVRVLMKGMEEVFPNLVKVLIHERDQLMVENLRQCKGTLVGVVGMAHMDGIERLWKKYETKLESAKFQKQVKGSKI